MAQVVTQSPVGYIAHLEWKPLLCANMWWTDGREERQNNSSIMKRVETGDTSVERNWLL
jgi:beta-lactamase superfamily II metal-dependent hydrolase